MNESIDRVAESQGFADADCDIMFKARKSSEGTFNFDDKTFITEEGMRKLREGLDDFLKSLEPVVAPAVKPDDIAKAIADRFHGKVTGQNGMLQYFGAFDGKSKLNPDDAKRVAQEFGLEARN